MKSAIIIASLVFCFSTSYGQKYILTEKGDSIYCRIDTIISGTIYYTAPDSSTNSISIRDVKCIFGTIADENNASQNGNIFDHSRINRIENLKFQQEYSEIIQIDSASKDELFVRARSWFSKVFNNPQLVIEISDKEIGELQGKGTFTFFNYYGSDYNGLIQFSIGIFCKNGKYKYVLNSFTHKGDPLPGRIGTWKNDLGPLTDNEACPTLYENSGGHGSLKPIRQAAWEKAKRKTAENMEAIINSLKDAMSEKPDDW